MFLFVFALTVGLNSVTSDRRSCCRYPSELVLDCSHCNLSNDDLPSFKTDILHIDLSFNKLNNIPGGLPSHLKYLNLNSNTLMYNEQTFPPYAFSNLVKLKNLSIACNNDKFDVRNMSYPKLFLASLGSLVSLAIDGLNGINIGNIFGNETYLQILNLSGIDGGCYMTTLKKKTFEKFIHLTHLYISHCNIKRIEAGVFATMAKLWLLDISQNKELTISVLTNITEDLQFSNITHLKLDELHCTWGLGNVILRKHIRRLKNTPLETISLNSNRIELIEKGALTFLPKTLKRVSLGDNKLTFGWFWFEIRMLTSLRSLNVSFQGLTHQPRTYFFDCNDWCEDCHSVHRMIRSDVVKGKQTNAAKFKSKLYDFNATYYIPKTLQKLYIHDNLLQYAVKQLFFAPNNSVTHIYARNNVFYELIGPINGLIKLVHLDLSQNFCSNISFNFFATGKRLKHLNLSNNLLGKCLEKDLNGNIFGHDLENLIQFDLSNNVIIVLPELIFRGIKNLKYLNLSYNKIEKWSVQINHMKNIVSIDLSLNRLPYLSQKTREELDHVSKNRVIWINLEGNPIMCGCGKLNIAFLKWMFDSENVKLTNIQNYTCTFSNSTTVILNDLHSLVLEIDKECASYTLIITVATSFLFVVITILLSSLIYRFRWRIRYLYYIAKSTYKGHKIVGNQGYKIIYQYDAFISYADEDREFVLKHILALEEKHALKFCLHSRDFLPGIDIAENITNAVHESRRTICILTSHYLKSYWCMFELNMARIEGIYARDSENILLLVLLQKNIVKDMPLFLLDLIESKSYLEFTETQPGTEVFGIQLVETLLSSETNL